MCPLCEEDKLIVRQVFREALTPRDNNVPLTTHVRAICDSIFPGDYLLKQNYPKTYLNHVLNTVWNHPREIRDIFVLNHRYTWILVEQMMREYIDVMENNL